MQRRLTPEEIELWRKVTATVRPRRPQPLQGLGVAQKPIPEHRQAMPSQRSAASPLKSPPPPRTPQIAPQITPQALDARTLRDLRRERTNIDARIDLHGMRAAEAHRALGAFLRRAQQSGARMVLVVTGKGRSKSEDVFCERGVLRRHAPLWLAEGELAAVVSGFSRAADVHGGDGALYVRLRRRAAAHH